MIQRFDRAITRALGQEINEALRAVAERHGISITYAGGSFADSNAVIKVACAVRDANGVAVSKEAEAFERYRSIFRIPAHVKVGSTFTANGETFAIAGLRPSAHKRPLLAKRSRDGKGFVFPLEAVLSKVAADESVA